jgi:hypothetical protein
MQPVVKMASHIGTSTFVVRKGLKRYELPRERRKSKAASLLLHHLMLGHPAQLVQRDVLHFPGALAGDAKSLTGVFESVFVAAIESQR